MLDEAARRSGQGAAARGGSVPPGSIPLNLWPLLARHGRDFVEHAFLELTSSKPAPHALDHYLQALTDGRATKIRILGEIRYGAEGRAEGRTVPGLRRRFLLQRAYDIPVLGRLLRIAATLPRLPRLLRDLQRLEQGDADSRERIAGLEKRLIAADRAAQGRARTAEAELARLGLRVRETGSLGVQVTALRTELQQHALRGEGLEARLDALIDRMARCEARAGRAGD